MSHQTTSSRSEIPRGLVLVLSAAAGLSAANLYYAQPLLHTIANAFEVGSGTAGLIVTLSQIGYAIGLALVVPAGDIVQRRMLSFLLLMGTSVALVASALTPGIGVLIGLAALIGLGSVAAQVLVPMAASLASDGDRGRVVGNVMTGLLLGVLLARTLSGILADVVGWRGVYGIAAGIALVLGITLLKALPADGKRSQLSYPQLLGSTVALFQHEPLLRRRMLYGFLSFASFSVLWTTLAFMLAAPPYGYGDAVIGLFGLVGAAGALCANFAGRFVDRGLGTLTTTVFAVMIAGSFGLIYMGHTSLFALLIGILILDIGVSGLQITNQSYIYELAPDARSRITANYMTAYFVGGAVGSAVASALYERAGWGGICMLGAVLGIGIVASHVVSQFRADPATAGNSTAGN